MKKELKSFKGLHVSVTLQVVLDSHHEDLEYQISIKRNDSDGVIRVENHYYLSRNLAFQAFSQFVQPLLY